MWRLVSYRAGASDCTAGCLPSMGLEHPAGYTFRSCSLEQTSSFMSAQRLYLSALLKAGNEDCLPAHSPLFEVFPVGEMDRQENRVKLCITWTT